MKLEVILVAAGAGTRLKAAKPKALVLLKSKPLVWYSLKIFEAVPSIDAVVLVVHKKSIDAFRNIVRRGRFKKVKIVTPGGETRADSVACGLKCVDAATDVVMVHDAARPLVTKEMVKASVEAIKKERAVIVAVPVTSTIKRTDPKNLHVLETLPRQILWEAQTPQTFRKDVLIKAHASNVCLCPTDDAMMAEKMGVKVKIVAGDYRNIKVTTKEDLILAQMLLEKKI